jgi:FecR protein
MSQKQISTSTLAFTLRPAAQAALLACLSAGAWAQSPPASTVQPAATLEFVQGNVAVRSAAGASRVAQRGTVVNNGETIETQSGRAQMRMVDGAFISLQNDTTLRLDNYRVASATEPESGFMSLVRGGLRTVTGLIGRNTKQNYRLQTATATVGIRGTGFSATSGDDGTRVRVSEGAIALCTQGGCLDLAALQTGFAPNANTLPIRIAAAPVLQPTQAPSVVVLAPQPAAREIDPETLISSRGDHGSLPETIPAFPPRIPLTGTATGMGAAYNTPSTLFNAGLLGGTLTFDQEGRLLEFVDSTSGDGYRATAASISDFGSDGIIAWGRWNGGNTTTYFGSSTTGSISHFSYVTGNSGAAVPIVGTYNVFGSTAPVVIDAVTGGVALVGASNSVTGSMQINFPGATGGSLTYNLAIPLAGQIFNLTGTAAQYGGTSFLGNYGAGNQATSTGTGCNSGCTGIIPYGNFIQGAIFGAGNTRVGAQYGFSSDIGKVTGAVVLRPAAN